ncbi:hypothetical protein RvY_00512 [Ramazzottius varieornatus]|uniref:Uncharacterized protein n=1 Tax=Ramazzottius varieornatus TaxID=947166 RepID=A0A1D1UGN8_RAMVA|nr:hypothetical protein RvY_00512 [Ramazzottius varieornatus]
MTAALATTVTATTTPAATRTSVTTTKNHWLSSMFPGIFNLGKKWPVQVLCYYLNDHKKRKAPVNMKSTLFTDIANDSKVSLISRVWNNVF